MPRPAKPARQTCRSASAQPETTRPRRRACRDKVSGRFRGISLDGGRPTPFRSTFNVCFQTVFAANVSGGVDVTTGELALATSTQVLVYLTSTEPPCPRCVDHVCQGGARNGLACMPSASLEQTSLDCPPRDDQFYIALGGPAANFSNGRVTKTASDGLFCQDQRNPGAFGNEDVRRIEEAGTPAGSLLDLAPHPTSGLDVHCDGSTGPGTRSLTRRPTSRGRRHRASRGRCSSAAEDRAMRTRRSPAPRQKAYAATRHGACAPKPGHPPCRRRPHRAARCGRVGIAAGTSFS